MQDVNIDAKWPAIYNVHVVHNHWYHPKNAVYLWEKSNFGIEVAWTVSYTDDNNLKSRLDTHLRIESMKLTSIRKHTCATINQNFFNK